MSKEYINLKIQRKLIIFLIFLIVIPFYLLGNRLVKAEKQRDSWREYNDKNLEQVVELTNDIYLLKSSSSFCATSIISPDS